MSIIHNIIHLEKIKRVFKRTIPWNKYRPEIKTKSKKISLDCMIDPTLSNINRLFVLSFKNGDGDPTRNSFDKYYMPSVEIKDFNVSFDYKLFSDQFVKNKL